MALTFDRRTLLKNSFRTAAGLVVVGAAGGLLEACGSDAATPAATGPVDLGALDYQLSWVKNVEFAGQYIADTKGYYKAAGFSSVNLIAGGPTVAQDSVVAAGKALVGISSPDITASAIISGGAPLVIIGAQYQKNPFAIMSLPTNPINTPADLIGKKIGVQATNEAVWNAFLAANKIDPGSVTKVPVQFDPTPLTQPDGGVDGWFSFFTNEPNELKEQGFDTVVMLLNDYGYPMVSEVYVVRKDSLTSKRDQLKAMLIGDIKGWADSVADPSAGANLVVTVESPDGGYTVEEQTLESAAQNTVISTDETKANGLFTITDEKIDQTISTLALAGITIDKATLFDMSVLEEVYAENPSLKGL